MYTHDSVTQMRCLWSCNRALSYKRGNWRIPEQIREPNFAMWTHWALQAQTSQPLCKYSVLSICGYTGGQMHLLASYLSPLNVTITMLFTSITFWFLKNFTLLTCTVVLYRFGLLIGWSNTIQTCLKYVMEPLWKKQNDIRGKRGTNT